MTRFIAVSPTDSYGKYWGTMGQKLYESKHHGPDEPASGRIGEPAIRHLLEQHGESLVIFGHCYWDDPYAEIGKHQILNVDSRVFLLLDSERT